MNYFKVNLPKRKVLSKTRVFVISTMAVFVFLCGSCELIGIIEPDEFEPNNSLSQAYPVEQGDIYIADIADADADFFSFSTTHGSATFDELEISVTNVGPDLQIGVAVYDPEGQLVGTKGSETAGANLTYTLSDLRSDGTYSVRFSGIWDVDFTPGDFGDLTSKGSYSFVVKNLNANDEFAGNHSINDAAPIETGVSYDGVLVSNLETDYFAFTPTSESMQLQITNVGASLQIGVALYLPNKELASGTYAHGTSTPGADYTVNLTSMNTEYTYYIRYSGIWDPEFIPGDFGDLNSHGPYTFVLVDN